MSTIRLNQKNWENLQKIALYESNKEGEIIQPGKLLNEIVEKAFERELKRRKLDENRD